MKKILTTISLLLCFTFIASGLYVFKLPPFQKGSPLSQTTQNSTINTNATSAQNITDTASETSGTKIVRPKTYAEYMQKGALLEKNNYHALAIAEFQEAEKLDPSKIDPLMEIGKIYLRNNQYPEAQTVFEEITTMNSQQIDAKIYLGRSLLSQRKISEAQDLFKKINTENQNVKYYQGILAAYSGDYDNSKKLLTRAVEIGTDKNISSKAQNFLNAYSEFDFNQGGEKTHLKALIGRSLNQTGEYQLAIPLMFEVIKEKKDYRDAWVLLGYAYLQTEKYQDALEALTEAKKLDPAKPETLFFLGLGYYGLNNLPLAAQTLELAKRNGFQPTIQVDQKLAEIYLQLKDYNKSAENYEKVVGLNDNDVHYYIRPIWIYLEKLNEPDKALALAQKAMDHHSDEAMSYNLLAWAQMYNNQPEEAEKNLVNGLNIDPKLDAIYLNFGLLSEKKGEFDKALAYYRKAHSMGNGDSISASATERYNLLIAKTKNIDNQYVKVNVFNP